MHHRSRTLLIGLFLFMAAGTGWVVTVGSGAAPGGGAGTAFEPGDLNGDEAVDISDAVYLLRYLFGSGPPPAVAEPPIQVYLIRHAEKASGKDVDTLDPPLSPEGEERARKIAEIFAKLPLDSLVVSDLIRTQQTLQPTADAQSITPHMTISTPASDAAEAVADHVRSLPPGSRCLIAHHSFTIPAILDTLGVPEAFTTRVVGFDQLWLVNVTARQPSECVPLKYPSPEDA